MYTIKQCTHIAKSPLLETVSSRSRTGIGTQSKTFRDCTLLNKLDDLHTHNSKRRRFSAASTLFINQVAD